MSNPYFTFTLPAVPGALIDAIIYNEEMTNISEAFDGMPPAVQFIENTLSYSSDNGSCVNKSATLLFSPTGDYIFGEQLALKVNIPNNSLTTVGINNRGNRPVYFDRAGGAVAQDMLREGIYSFVFDGSRFLCLQMSRRGIVGSETSAAKASTLEGVSSGTVIGSIEFFTPDDSPLNYYPSTAWDMLTDSVDSLTDGVISSTDLIAWIRRA